MPRLTLSTAIMALVLAGPALAQTRVTLGQALEPPNLDPTSGAAAAIRELTHLNIYEGLTRFRPDGTVAPGLAKSWEVSEDGRVWTFHLQEGVKFHDGTTMDAEDVRFTLDRARAPDSTNAQKHLFKSIETVEVVDPLTVRVVLSAPSGTFDFNMAWGDAVIMGPESAATNATQPVGTGPYRLAQWVKGDRVDLSANPDYWGEQPAITDVTFRFIPDPAAAMNAMMAGDVDAFPNYPAPETLALFVNDPRFQVIEGTTEGETILGMNNRRAPLDDIRLRKAIGHAIDRQEIIDGAMFGYGTPIGTHFAPHHPAYVDLTALSDHDPDKARALLAEIGPVRVLDLQLPPPSYARRGGEILAAQLREVGIETRITNVEWAQWLEKVFKGGDFDLTIISHTEPMDINIYARDDYYFGYAKPEFVALNEQIQVETDPARRIELLQQAQRMIAEDHVNAFLFQLPKTTLARAGLQGLWQNTPAPIVDLAGLHWQP